MRPPPESKPPPHPPDTFISINSTTNTSNVPSILDCGAEGHIVTSTKNLIPSSIRPSNMTTQAFSGATAPITHIGDHVSGNLPRCHVVPQSAFNLVAASKYIDDNNCAIILTGKLALQLDNIDFDRLVQAENPAAQIIRRLQQAPSTAHPPVRCRIIGVRRGPHSLYHTDLLSSIPNTNTKSIVTNVVTNCTLKFLNPRSNRTPPQPPNTQQHHQHLQPLTHSDMSQFHIHVNMSTRSKLLTTNTPANPKPPPPPPPPLSHSGQTDSSPPWITSTTITRALRTLRRIHCAMGHPSDQNLLHALRNSPSPQLRSLCKYIKLMDQCNVCPAGTQKAKSHPKKATTRSTKYLSRLVMDLSGKQPVASLGGNFYFFLIVDDCTRFKWVRFVKSPADVAATFDNFLRTVVRQGTTDATGRVRSVSFVRTDNGPDFNSNAFRQVLQLHSITTEPSPPDASNQRGLAERGIGVVAAITRASLLWARAPFSFWAEAVDHAVTTSNNRPHSANPSKSSPYQMVNPNKPSQILKLRPFGCLSFTYIPTKHRTAKLNPASSIGFLASYGTTPDGTINGYRVMNFTTQRFSTKYNVDTNQHIPALQHILSVMSSSPQQLLIGRRIVKRFSNKDYTGTISSYSTLDNETLYDISYDDGDSEQMDIIDILKHIAPMQPDTKQHTPTIHPRISLASPSDQTYAKRLAPSPTQQSPQQHTHKSNPNPSQPRSNIRITRPSSTILLRRSSRTKKPPNRLTSIKPVSYYTSPSPRD